MTFETLGEWQAYAPRHLLEVIRQGSPPTSWEECRNSHWEGVLVFFCENNYCIEHLNFLWAVSQYRGKASVITAEEIIENFIYGSQPLNLYAETSGPIDDWYKDDDRALKVDLFDRAEGEIVESFSGTYGHFRSVVSRVRQQLLSEGNRPD